MPHLFIDTRPVEELVLKLTDPTIATEEGKRRARATATLEYAPATSGARRIESRRYTFTAPLGPIEKEDLRWYLESYFLWPVGVFKDRADGIERKLPAWGADLFGAAFDDEEAREALTSWQNAKEAERRFSVEVNSDLPKGANEEAQAAAREAATELLSLPWELLHDGRVWLFKGKHPVRVRRRLPNRQVQPARQTALPIRILLVSPRPEKDAHGNPIGFIDHRASARPLTEAVESLGDLARLTILQPPTYAALEAALQAGDEGQPFDVIHFDGHGIYDHRSGMGGLCFEDPRDERRLAARRMDFVVAARLGRLVREHRIPLVFLEACQSAVAEGDPTASVAARLLEEGVASVVAMSHTVLVETTRRFVQAFYAGLARGARIGQAMLAGQQALFADTWRGKILGAGDLRLQDWFVPVLYQEEQDPQLFTKIPPQQVRQLEKKKRRLSLGALPDPPPHHFQGRSHDLLALERLLHRESWAVVRGTGGQGKTTLATELARWLVRTGRFERAAFVSLKHHRYPEAVLDTLGHQLLPEGDKYSVAQFPDLDKALQPVERALTNQPTIVVLDNCESVLPERGEPAAALDSEDASSAIFALCQRLLKAGPRTRFVFTTREPLPMPFDHRGHERELGALSRNDAIELVSEVMKQNGRLPPSDDLGNPPEEIRALIEVVNCHALALVVLAPEVARRGVKAKAGDLRSLMAGLERKQNSLYASVKLALRRLSAKSRGHVRVLAVCEGGMYLRVLETLTGLGPEAGRQLANELVEVGLGEDMDYGHLRLDPGLPPYLLGELTADEAEALRSRWAESMARLTDYLYREQFKDARLARQLTLLELPNLLAMLDWIQSRWPPELVVKLAANVEMLVAELGRPQALVQASLVREQAAEKLGDWGPARFTAEAAHIDRLLENGDLPAAHALAQRLLAKSLAAGETAFPEAAYAIAEAHFRLGLVLRKGVFAGAALVPLAEAQRRYQELSCAGDAGAERMVAVTIAEVGDCFLDLGRLEDSARAYEERLRGALSMRDLRGAAAAKGQLGTVRLLQNRYQEALESHVEARDTFEALGEPRMVATAWHQIGIVHEGASQFEAAEQAYRQSLAIKVRENNLAGQSETLTQLGNLYDRIGRLEEAVTFYRQAAQIDVKLKNLANEGKDRSNMARTLIQLRRYDEARQELQRTIECFEPYGHAVEPWKAWANLENLERNTGQTEAARAARQQAIETYLAYRRAGGVSHSGGDKLLALVAQSILQNAEGEARQILDEVAAKPDTPLVGKALIARLRSILAGDRNPALADDPELNYGNAAELQLLLEGLGQDNPKGGPT